MSSTNVDVIDITAVRETAAAGELRLVAEERVAASIEDERLLALYDSRAQHVRSVLLSAAARGRPHQPYPTVNKVLDRKASPLAPGLVVEELEYCVDASHAQGWVPLRIMKKAPALPTNVDGDASASASAPPAPTAGLPPAPGSAPGPTRLPVVIFMHATGGDLTSMGPRQEEYAKAGFLTAAIDCVYHGARCILVDKEIHHKRDVYEAALVRAYLEGPERAFLLDNVWDVIHLLDVLVARPDVDADRIGMMGVSLGGMHTWLAAVADTRLAAIAPLIGVQGFQWALDNDAWHARVASIPTVFNKVAEQLGKPEVDGEVVAAVWNKLLPGLLEHYDAPHSLPAIAPRPMLIANGERDERCPIEGVKESGYARLERVQRQRQRAQQEQQQQQAQAAAVTAAAEASAHLVEGEQAGTSVDEEASGPAAPSDDSAQHPAAASGSETETAGNDSLVTAMELLEAAAGGEVPPLSEEALAALALSRALGLSPLHTARRAAAAAAAAQAAVEAAAEAVTAVREEAATSDAAEAASVSTAVGTRLRLMVDTTEGGGHRDTAAMNRAVRLFFEEHLMQRKRHGVPT